MAMTAALSLVAATPAIAQQGGATVTAATTQGPILSFSVSEDVRARPDQATIGAGVPTTAPTTVAALQANSAAMDKLIAAPKAQRTTAHTNPQTGLTLTPQQHNNHHKQPQ